MSTNTGDQSADPTIPVSVFENASDNRPTMHMLLWHALAERLGRYDERALKDGKAWSPVSYLPGTTRGKANVDQVFALVLDFDHGLPDWQLIDDYEYVAHTTHSHTVEEPRWRVVLPLSRPIDGTDWPAFWLRANAWFGGCVDPATKDASRLFYLPSCPPGAPHLVRHQHGGFLDPDSLPEVPAYEPPPASARLRGPSIVSRHLADWAARFALAKTDELAAMPQGSGRNSACNRIAHLLAGLVADPAHDMREEWVREALLEACARNGLIADDGERSVLATIESGFASGSSRPWSPADRDPHVNHTRVSPPVADQAIDPSLVDVVPMSAIEREELHWLWLGRLCRGKLCVLMGDPGLGKSLVTIHCASVVSRGGRWPDGEQCEQGAVIILSAEDGPADTIRPRLDAAGADVDQVFLLRSVREQAEDKVGRMLRLQTDIAMLEATVQRVKARLVIIDPLNAYMGGVDSHKAAEVRGILAPLSAMADRSSVSVLLVHHLNKGSSANALYRAGGSLDFVAAARSVLGVAYDKDDPERKVIVSVKLNIAQRPPGLGYQIVSSSPHVNSPPLLRWDAKPVDIDPVQAFADNRTPEERWRARALKELLLDLFKSRAEWPVSELQAHVRAAGLGSSDKAVRAGLHDVGAQPRRSGFQGSVVWFLPSMTSMPEYAETEQTDGHTRTPEPSYTEYQSMTVNAENGASIPGQTPPYTDIPGHTPHTRIDLPRARARTREGTPEIRHCPRCDRDLPLEDYPTHMPCADTSGLPEGLCPIHRFRFDMHECDLL